MPATDHDGPIPFHHHDHANCRVVCLEQAEVHCAETGAKLTPPRRCALELLTSQHRAFGAYEVLDALAAEGLGTQPPAAYRALEFLTAHGLAHRIERLNAYVACPNPELPHRPAFLICTNCKTVAEATLPLSRAAADEAAAAAGFQVHCMVIEAMGLCPDCAAAEARSVSKVPSERT